MKAQHRSRRRTVKRGLAGLTAGALVTGVLAAAHIAIAQSGADEPQVLQDTEVVPGGVYGWGYQGPATSAAQPWSLEFANTQAPLIDVAAFSDGGNDPAKATLAVTEDGDLVADGEHGVVTPIPASVQAADIAAVDIGYQGAAAVVTAQGGIISWNGAATPPAMTDAIDVEIGHQYGIALKANGTLQTWGDERMVEATPALSEVVKVVAAQFHAFAVTEDGSVHAWGYGNVNQANLNLPAEVTEATIVDVAAAGNANYALTDAGDVLAWGSAAQAFPAGQANGQVISLTDATTANRFMAATDGGQLIAWGGGAGGVHALLRTVPDHLQGYEILAMASGNSHHAVILGEQLDTGPAPVASPTFEGELQVGSTLTGQHAEFNFEPEAIQAQWLTSTSADGSDPTPVGDDDLSLTLSGDHENLYVGLRSIATHPEFGEIESTSTFGGPVEPAPEPGPIDPPTIEGPPVVGATLNGVHATFNFEPMLVLHQWYRSPNPDGSSGTTVASPNTQLTLTDAHLGQYIGFQTIGIAPGGGGQFTIRSEYVGPVVEFAVDEPSAIQGEALVGQTLTGVPATFTAEPDEVSYAWMIGTDEVIEVEDGEPLQLVLTEDHVGAEIRLRTTGEIDGIDPVESISEPTEPVELPPFEAVNPPVLSGIAQVGRTVQATEATFTLPPETVVYTWHAWQPEAEAPEVIEGAEGLEFEVTEDQLGADLQVLATAVRDGEEPVESWSERFGPVVEADIPVEFLTDPAIAGIPLVGETLTGTPATFEGDIDGEPVNQWLANGTPIEGATGATLELTTDHIGAVISYSTTVVESFSGQPMTAVSDPVGPVLDILAEVDPPTIAGTPQVGNTLNATPATFRGDPETVTGQWLVNGQPLDGETSTALVLTEEHEGARISFANTAVRGDAQVVSTSEETDEVLPEDDGGNGGGGGTGPPGPGEEREGGISAPSEVRPGETITVSIGEGDEYAGETVRVWLFSTPRDLGTFTVSAEGTISVTIPADMEPGEHQLAVYDADGGMIGWQWITVVGEDGTTAPAGTGSTGTGGSLPATGAETPPAMLALGMLLVMLGGVALVAARMRKELRL